MRILACSDLHCDVDATARFLSEAAQADVLVVAGDIATRGQGDGPLLSLLRRAPKPMILVPGNHDNLSDLRRFCHDWQTGHLLHGDGVTLQGVAFFGVGAGVPRGHDALWNFGLSEGQADAMLQGCPPGAVMVTHSPPKGHCDRQKDGTEAGSTATLKALQTRQPRLHLCGHIHASFGATSRVGDCPIHNLGPVPHHFSV